MPARLVLAAAAVALAFAAWALQGFARVSADFADLVNGPLPPLSQLFLWSLPASALAAYAALHLLLFALLASPPKFKREGLVKATCVAASGVFAMNVAATAAFIAMSGLFRTADSHRAEWILLTIVPAAIPCAIWILIVTGIWWLAPTFQSLRDGSLPTLPPYPLASLTRTVAIFVAQWAFRTFWIGRYGLWSLFILDGVVLAIRFGVIKVRGTTSTFSAS